VICLAPRAPGDSVRPRRSSGVVVRPLNFTVRRHVSASARTVVLASAWALLATLSFTSCSLERQIDRAAVPDTNLTIVLTEDEKQMARYQVLVDGSVVDRGFFGPHDADWSPHHVATVEGNLITFTWRGSLITQFVQFNVATCQIVRDSSERTALKIPGCKSLVRRVA